MLGHVADVAETCSESRLGVDDGGRTPEIVVVPDRSDVHVLRRTVPILLRVHHQARLFQSLRPELRWQTHAPVGDQRDPVELEPDLATLGLDVIDRFFRVGPRLEAEVYVRRDLPAVATPLLVLAVGAHTAQPRVAADGEVDRAGTFAASLGEHAAIR